MLAIDISYLWQVQNKKDLTMCTFHQILMILVILMVWRFYVRSIRRMCWFNIQLNFDFPFFWRTNPAAFEEQIHNWQPNVSGQKWFMLIKIMVICWVVKPFSKYIHKKEQIWGGFYWPQTRHFPYSDPEFLLAQLNGLIRK